MTHDFISMVLFYAVIVYALDEATQLRRTDSCVLQGDANFILEERMNTTWLYKYTTKKDMYALNGILIRVTLKK